MLDRFTASFYQKQDKLKALITVKTMQFQRDSGFLVSKSRASFANCLDDVRPNIYQFGLSLANSFKVTCHCISSLLKQGLSCSLKRYSYLEIAIQQGLAMKSLTQLAVGIFLLHLPQGFDLPPVSRKVVLHILNSSGQRLILPSRNEQLAQIIYIYLLFSLLIKN